MSWPAAGTTTMHGDFHSVAGRIRSMKLAGQTSRSPVFREIQSGRWRWFGYAGDTDRVGKRREQDPPRRFRPRRCLFTIHRRNVGGSSVVAEDQTGVLHGEETFRNEM